MAADFTKSRPNENRRPEFTELPDGRKRLTRYLDLADADRVADSLVEAYGTLDAGDTGGSSKTATFAGLRLVNQYLQRTDAKQASNASTLVKVYEELDRDGETRIGNPTRIKLEDGRTALEVVHWQFSDKAFAPGTVGASTYSGDSSAYLQKVEAPDDGTLRKITRTYVYAGILRTEDESLQGGKLLKKTIVSAKTASATPAGYTQVGEVVASPDGLPVYTVTYYKGDGEVSRDASTDNGGRLQRVVIRHLTAPDAASPAEDPLDGGVLIATDRTERDGHVLWTFTWAKGAGLIAGVTSFGQSSDGGETGSTTLVRTYLAPLELDDSPSEEPGFAKVAETVREEASHRVWVTTWAKGAGTVVTETRKAEGGKVVVYHRVALGSAPSTPTATIGGTVTATATNVREAEGFKVYDYTWVEGLGEISRETTTSLGGMLQRITLRHATALATGTQPTSDPLSGGTITIERRADEDGYRVWTVTWTKANTTEFITDDATKENQGKLVLYRRSKLGGAPATPSATLGGTVVETSARTRLEDGYTVYEKSWAEGYGVYAKRTAARDVGLREETWESLGPTFDEFMTPPGTLLRKDYVEGEGATRWTVSCMQKPDGAVLDYDIGAVTGTTVTAPGGSYTAPPDVAFSAAPGGGVTATGHSTLSGSGVATIVIDTPGRGYTSAPTITITPVLGDLTGSGATATCTIDGSPQTALTFQQWVEFMYPGRAKYFSASVGSAACKDVYLSPPVETKVRATVEITYRTSDELALAYPFWNPSEWATLNAKWQSWGNFPRTKVEGLRGYRALNSGATGTAGSMGFDTTLFGDRVFGGSSWAVVLTGGPDDPGGETLTLSARADPVFVDFTGTQYFRHTITWAEIPAQADVPV